MAGVARQSHMGRVPLAPPFLLLLYLPSALRPSQVRFFHFLDTFHIFRFAKCLGFRLAHPLFRLCRITQTVTPSHSGPNRFPLGQGLQTGSQNRTQGQQGLHAGIKGSLRFAIYSRSRGQGRKGRKGRKNYGPNSCVTCGTCVTGSVYCTSTSRCPLLRWLRKVTPCSPRVSLQTFINCFSRFGSTATPV